MAVAAVAVKICGLTNLEDARYAWRAGADLLGFVLVAGTPRYVEPSYVATMVSALRAEGCSALIVGVFGHQPMDVVRAIAQECWFDLVQLHGVPRPEEVATLGLPALIAHRVGTPSGPGNVSRDVQDLGVDWIALAAYRAWGYVLDGYHPGLLGGTGMAWDWRLAASRPEGFGRTLIAGGLTPDNVAEAVRLARPWGVDVSSGVESAPGRKDPALVARFIERAKGA